MSTYDARLAALEKDVTGMKQDIIYKLDDTNSAVTIITGVMGSLAQDVKVMNLRLDGIDTRLARLEERQNEQGQGIKDIKRRLDGMDKRFDGMDQRFDGIDQRFTSLEQKFDQRFDQVLQVLATLTNKAE